MDKQRLQELAGIQLNEASGRKAFIKAVAVECTSTIGDMLDDPENYGWKETDVEGLNYEEVVKAVAALLPKVS